MSVAARAFLPRKVIPIVPYSAKGRYRNAKSLILVVAYAVYFCLPWLTWHGSKRTGQPILFDLATLRVNFFDLVIFPHDLIILVGILVLGVVLLFMTATLYGRLFCGFFCFQTLWTDAFRWIERAVQGEAPARQRLLRQPWSAGKAARIGLTHVLWLLLAFATALTFPLYFLEAPALFARILHGTAPTAAYITVIALTASTYIAAGLAREKICLVACPYGKFQTAMQDPATLTVVYDRGRGDRSLGRASAASVGLKETAARAERGYGDCVDCNYCVNVCPTGVDIRKGFQIDCISCGLCIDACNTIMDSLRLPRGLIRFDRIAQPSRPRRFNYKTLGYSGVIAAMLGYVIYSAAAVAPFDATVQHQRQPLVTQLSNGDLKNRYVLCITNKTMQAAWYTIKAEDLPAEALSGAIRVQVPAGRTYTQMFNVVLPEKTAQNTEKFRLTLMQQGHPETLKTFDLTYYSGLARQS